MNICTFMGVVEEPIVLENDNGVSFVNFTLSVYNYRKTKTGEKSREVSFVPCQAWSTGAETLAERATPGTKILAQCSIKSTLYEDGQYDNVFRINEFEILG